ncbi:hypothetical protein PCC9214_00622 [Planktothrix tepida]|uniref:HNH nuclease domain-containing protein n=1 Tax=Planktothrix tepida PCC 9214 TaxID=671072 RepID=A0A1J1LEB4_9CYAN|nr:hypothetical protein [Planktothrix tepida]CAD5920402.1 hypothetical protein PCC9214_00622 [Planktothrix tepida]CUR30911.1 conserved hypothetical protein [Planktothrix tepida PCC 9214]
MRWIDIDQLEIPDGWQAKADKALNELRQEIECAEQKARSAGEDIRAARRKAISEGLDKSSRKKIWQELNSYLAKLRNGKCWYSESLNPGSNKDVDHFRPKNRVYEDPDHEGYWWLAFDWRNYRYSCQLCNQHRVDTANNTNGGKWDRFPISGAFRARQEVDNLEMEDVDLLDSIDPEDWKLLTFRPNGQPIPAKRPGTREYERAEISIQVYHLNYQEFVRDRKKLATTIHVLIERMEIYRSKITDSTMITLYKNSLKELFRLIDRDSEYSAAALAYARSEVYKMERGHQVKREWLEKILN